MAVAVTEMVSTATSLAPAAPETRVPAAAPVPASKVQPAGAVRINVCAAPIGMSLLDASVIRILPRAEKAGAAPLAARSDKTDTVGAVTATAPRAGASAPA